MFLLFHLYCVTIVPHQDVNPTKRSVSIPKSYIDLFGFGSNWAFFAPDVASYQVYLEWDLFDSNRKLIENSRWPPAPDYFYWKERLIRRMSSVQFMARNEATAGRMMKSFLCHRKPNVSSIRLWRTVYLLPNYKKEQVEPGDLPQPFKDSNRHLILDEYCDDRGLS